MSRMREMIFLDSMSTVLVSSSASSLTPEEFQEESTRERTESVELLLHASNFSLPDSLQQFIIRVDMLFFLVNIGILLD